jgi:SLT domain-containing protein
MLIKMALVNAMKSAFGGSTGGGGSLFGSMFSAVGSAFGGGKATGGPVTSDKFYLVGENGPELFAPGTSGTIIPNHVLKRTPTATGASHTHTSAKSSNETPITVIVNAQTGQSKTTGDDGDLARLGQLIGNKVREVIMTEKRQGGLLAV